MERVAVIGAGSTGLTIGWYLQRAGVEVHVVDRVGVAGGSSRGNAGWLTPPLAGPLPEPAVLRYAVRAMFSTRSPLHISPRPSRRMAAFLTQLARNSTAARWSASMRHLAAINAIVFDAFDELEDHGVKVGASSTDILAVARTDHELEHLAGEITYAMSLGLDAHVDRLSGAEARALEPRLAATVGSGLLLGGQRTFDPMAFCYQLATDFRRRGGTVSDGIEVFGIDDDGYGVVLRDRRGEWGRFDAVVVATGAWLNDLTGRYGVRLPVQSGRGYSFTVPGPAAVTMPVYFPGERVVCTPLAGGTRVAGTMELGSPDAPFRHRRIRQIAAAIEPFLQREIDETIDEWCGSRPCSADGLPLVGRTRSSRVFVHGGHGMWGMTQGPATARLLAEMMLGRGRSDLLSPLDPRR